MNSKKHIGILTLVFQNYGTRLQAYALSEILKRIKPENFEIEVINLETTWTDAPLSYMTLLLQIIRAYKFRSIKYLFNRLRWRFENRSINKKDHSAERNKRHALFKSLCNQIPYTEKKYTCNDIRNGLLREYDAIIVGSDQVWNGIKVRNQDVFGLNFFSKKKLTYAASFGMTSIPKEMVADYKRNINSFGSLLLREKEAVEICRMLGRDDAKLVLDPTLLLQEKDYESLISQSELDIQENYILVYSLNYSYKIFKQAYNIAKRNNYKIIVLKRSFCPPNIKKSKDTKELYAVSPQGFLWLIKHAKCIITNSYHATLFSINFKKDFYLYLDNCDEENSRMLTVVKMFNLENQVYWETQNLPLDLPKIQYDISEAILNNYRKRSIDLLNQQLQTLL